MKSLFTILMGSLILATSVYSESLVSNQTTHETSRLSARCFNLVRSFVRPLSAPILTWTSTRFLGRFESFDTLNQISHIRLLLIHRNRELDQALSKRQMPPARLETIYQDVHEIFETLSRLRSAEGEFLDLRFAQAWISSLSEIRRMNLVVFEKALVVGGSQQKDFTGLLNKYLEHLPEPNGPEDALDEAKPLGFYAVMSGLFGNNAENASPMVRAHPNKCLRLALKAIDDAESFLGEDEANNIDAFFYKFFIGIGDATRASAFVFRPANESLLAQEISAPLPSRPRPDASGTPNLKKPRQIPRSQIRQTLSVTPDVASGPLGAHETLIAKNLRKVLARRLRSSESLQNKFSVFQQDVSKFGIHAMPESYRIHPLNGRYESYSVTHEGSARPLQVYSAKLTTAWRVNYVLWEQTEKEPLVLIIDVHNHDYEF